MPRKQRYKVAEIVAALREADGLHYLAAQRLGCSAQCLYDYRKRYPQLEETVRECRGLFVDLAENKLAKAVENGDLGAIKYTLSCLGKDRGFVENSNQPAIKLNLTLDEMDEMTDAELQAYRIRLATAGGSETGGCDVSVASSR